mmetsp:Transcript_5718/g.14858  ORF Transcript_5718/g.14858 Transcript_5718/m.14858 type:complete len:221 (+) Transcript_5718:185-847(+)
MVHEGGGGRGSSATSAAAVLSSTTTPRPSIHKATAAVFGVAAARSVSPVSVASHSRGSSATIRSTRAALPRPSTTSRHRQPPPSRTASSASTTPPLRSMPPRAASRSYGAAPSAASAASSAPSRRVGARASSASTSEPHASCTMRVCSGLRPTGTRATRSHCWLERPVGSKMIHSASTPMRSRDAERLSANSERSDETATPTLAAVVMNHMPYWPENHAA